MRRSLALTLFALAFAANAFATQARITGKVLDAVTKKPIPDATVNVVATEAMTYKADSKVKKDGSYAVAVLNGTIRYKFTYAAPGYRSYEEVIKLRIGEPNVKDVELTSAAAAAATVPASEIRVDPSVAAFNDGAQLANEGKDAEALAKFQEAVAAKPDLQAGWRAIAKVQARTKKYPEAIVAANKAIELDSDDTDMYAVLFEAYTATGDKARAAEVKGKLPANAALLFNDAARAINGGKDKDAEPLLRQAIVADEAFAPAYYELGMLYVRAGKNADAKTNLEKYIALDPSGRDVATAKEMLKYVK
ncbi:MAG TPA: carboxypeptidase regulatory-like domain-containing protein [Thermoanaerobaculia bacterium]|nr:carboxypeptidase regulatory-like domain-containing protein [Thermoanaerobaculia bacterium]